MSKLKKKSKTKYIYTITCLYDIPPCCQDKMSKDQYEKATKEYQSHGGDRCFGWFSSLKESKECVEKNYGDIHEGSYRYVVIEKMSDGIHGGFSIPKEWWYEWKEGKFVPIDKPEKLQHTISFGLG